MTNVDSFFNLEGKVVIITGAATGLGAATAQMLAEAGANVLINHMSGQEFQAQAVAKKCVSNGVSNSLCQPGDITKDEECKHIVQAALDKWGRVDILINNAGFNIPVDHDDLDGLSGQDFMNLYNVHVIGAYQMIRAAAPAMKVQGKGVVVNISSGSGEYGNGSSVAYSASKGALNTMTKSLGRALAPIIRVNAVCPGFIDTPLWEKLDLSEQEREELRLANVAETPLQLEATPEIISRSIVFLASDLSAHITGQLLTSDGGMLLGVYQRMFEKK